MTKTNVKVKVMTAAQKREARNEYSREWKAKHKKAVREWNKAWYAAKKRLAKKKVLARKAKKADHAYRQGAA